MAFPSGRLAPGVDRALVIAGYLIFTVASIPEMLFAGPHELGCDGCPTNVLLIRRDPDLANLAIGLQVTLYVVLFVIVLVRLVLRWRRTGQLERLQLTPVYVFGLLTFLLATAALAGAGDAAGWATFTATALLPFAFLAGLLRSHVARLDADLRARVVELRASRARLVEAGDTERRRLERNLHDGALARLVGVALLLGHARRRVEADPEETATLLDRAMVELKASLAELRELARGIHRPSSPSADSSPRCTRSPPARRSRSPSRPMASGASRPPWRSPRTSSSPRRSPTSRSTRRRPRPASPSAGRTGA
jgi:hypothetical protein